MSDKVKIWLVVQITRDEKTDALTRHYVWKGTDGLDYSPEFDDDKTALDYLKNHTLKPYDKKADKRQA